MVKRKIMLLGEKAKKLKQFFDMTEIVFVSSEPVTKWHIDMYKPTHVICFGYRHIIKEDVISAMPRNRILNLHPSYLPWGRGAHPNFWAWKNDEPHGVTIHVIDSGLDTGPIFSRKKVEFLGAESTMTLQSTYDTLELELIGHFGFVWRDIFAGRLGAKPQFEEGSKHLVKDLPQLPNGWQTTIEEVRKL